MPDKPALITAAAEAMATRFEVALHGEGPERLRAAAGEALAEITRLEGMLSLFEPTSEIARCNTRAAHEPVPVSPEVFALLQHCADLSRATHGAFDITIAPLMKCWRLLDDTGAVPHDEDIAAAREIVGIGQVKLDSSNFTVQFTREGVMLDLGSVGKGYALERAAGLLRENGFQNFLVHGGTSTVCARGVQPDGSPWRIAIEHPEANEPSLRLVDLHNESLSVSGIGGKSFLAPDGTKHGHVLDPRLGHPVRGARVAAVICESAAESDALATALLVDAAIAEGAGFHWLRTEMVNGQLTVDSNGLE